MGIIPLQLNAMQLQAYLWLLRYLKVVGCFQAPLLGKQLPIWIWETHTLATPRFRLKMFLFDKAYSYGWIR